MPVLDEHDGGGSAKYHNLGFCVDGKLVEVRQFELVLSPAVLHDADANAPPRDELGDAAET